MNQSNVVRAPKWTPNSEREDCNICEQRFGFVRRRHHCRQCGELVCNPCSEHKDYVPGYYSTKVRVCVSCFSRNTLCRKFKQAERQNKVMSAQTIKNDPDFSLCNLKS